MADKKVEEGDPSSGDFETAVSETGFGLYNLILASVATFSVLTSQLEVSSLSFVYPAAQCDLNLTLEDRGLINAAVYTGMIGSSFIFGSLSDVFGRRKILVISHFLDCIFILMASFAPSFGVLVAAKFLGGSLINGPSMALTPYLSEFHCTKYRSRVPLVIGLLYNIASICLPLIAWVILPLGIKLDIWGYELHSWNIFLFISIFPALASGFGFMLMPESPKYLMSKGNNEKALEIFQKVYNLNTKKPREEYPVKKLKDEKQIYHKKRGIREAWNQISPLFSRRYAFKLILVCLIMMGLMMCTNSFRLWLPEIFQAMNDYEPDNNTTASFCKILATMQPSGSDAETCSMNFDNDSVYINSIIVSSSAVVSYIVATICINKIGKKRILLILGCVSGVSAASIYFAPNTMTAIILICCNLAATGICIDTTVTVIVALFPTYLRASALSLTLMSGRLGSVLGNLMFPILLQQGCAPPFFGLGFIIIGCTILSVFLPNTEFKALE